MPYDATTCPPGRPVLWIGRILSGLVAAMLIELACVLLYVLPHTAVLGAVLLTGYLGGAIFAHLRVDDPVTVVVMIGVVAWGALFLRDPRLRRLLPLRSF